MSTQQNMHMDNNIKKLQAIFAEAEQEQVSLYLDCKDMDKQHNMTANCNCFNIFRCYEQFIIEDIVNNIKYTLFKNKKKVFFKHTVEYNFK